ncbi:MAG: hypothetical protein GC186_20315 [Rhodobacteraceae bacterium]|nr:hypothetical protein [Paracoccaceae bacterium]
MTLPWTDFLTVWALLAVNITSPGPNVLNTIASAMGSGRAAGLGSALGVALGIAVWCLGTTLGMAAVFALLPVAQLALTLIAVALLGRFAFRYLKAAVAGLRGDRRGVPQGRTGMSPRAAFIRSLQVSALNPKALTTWLAIVTIFPVARAQGGDIALLCVGASTLSLSIHTGYALAFSTAPAVRLYLRAAPWINGAVGLFFIGFALKLLAGVLH